MDHRPDGPGLPGHLPDGPASAGPGWVEWPVTRRVPPAHATVRRFPALNAGDARWIAFAALLERHRDLPLPGIVDVLGWGVDDRGPYAVAAGPGRPLLSAAADGQVPWASVAAAAFDALAVLHAAGVVHGSPTADQVRLIDDGTVLLGLPAPHTPDATCDDDVRMLAAAVLEAGATEATGAVLVEVTRARGAIGAAETARDLRAAEAVHDDDVQFTVYRPRALAPAAWQVLLAFAHRTDEVVLDDGTTLDPVEEVARQAERVLGEDLAAYRSSAQDADGPVPRGTDLSFVPEAPGIEFNPPSRTFAWMEPVHREEFRMRAGAALAGTTVRGRLSVYCGGVLIAEVPLALRVADGAGDDRTEPSSARRFRRVFASYSHRDTPVVRQVEAVFDFLGITFLRDKRELRAGEVWDDRLKEMIRQADVFQLFWSRNAMRSAFVAEEWRYALSLGRPGFVRPVYWEEPFPEDPSAGLPPEDLRRLHFQRLPREDGPPPAVPDAGPPPARRRSWTRAALASGASLAAVAAVVAGLVMGGGLWGDRGPGATPNDALIAFLPPLVASGCAPLGADATPAGATAAVNCRVGGATAYYIRFPDRARAERYRDGYARRLTEAGATGTPCEGAEDPSAEGVVCRVLDGDRYVLWTSPAIAAAGVLWGPFPDDDALVRAWRDALPAAGG